MCIQRFKLLMNVDTASVEDMHLFLKRALKIYALLTGLYIYYSVMTIMDSDKNSAIWDVTAAALYAFYCSSLYALTSSNRPILCTLHICSTALVLLTIFSIFDLSFSLYSDPQDYFELLTVVAIGIELSTLYIHYHLGLKLRNDNDVDEGLLEEII